MQDAAAISVSYRRAFAQRPCFRHCTTSLRKYTAALEQIPLLLEPLAVPRVPVSIFEIAESFHHYGAAFELDAGEL